MINRVTRRLALGALILAGAALAGAADWPQWRGPARDGISRETGLLQGWPEGGPKLLWEAALGGGWSAPAIADGRVFTMFQDPQGQHLTALDEQTGKPLWKTTIGPVFTAGRYPGARSTPTVDGDLVYAFDATANLACLKAANGEVVWKKDLMALTKVTNLKWGFAAAPFISGDLLVINIGVASNKETSDVNVAPKQEGESVWALNKKTGEVVWKALSEQAAYSTPVEFTSGGIEQFVLLSRFNVVGIGRKDGKLLWSHPYIFVKQNTNIADPIVSGDMIWVGSAYNTGSMVLQVDLAKNPPVREVWKSKALQTHLATPILRDGYLYGYDGDKLTCVEYQTGNVKWTDSTIRKGQLVYADGVYYVFGELGVLGMARLSPEKCEILGSAKLLPGMQRWAMPVVANGRLYIRDDKKMLCLDVKAK